MIEKKFIELVNVVRTLRGPNGCPWDKEQNLYSLKANIIEEAYELVEALDEKDIENIKEELGDLLLHVVFHSVVAEEAHLFTLQDVLDKIKNKLIYRHPHVFGNVEIKDSNGVLKNWEKIKRTEKAERKSVLDGIPKALPSLSVALKLQKRAELFGFDFEKLDDALKKVEEELKELKDTIESNDRELISEEVGDLLFSVINVARFLKINPDEALRLTNKKFIERIKFIEEKLAISNNTLESATLDELNNLWEDSKEK
jgi:tetrapyrrole methylase family protein/MazG family protein